MSRTNQQHVTICTLCSRTGKQCRAGYELIARLRASIEAAGASIGPDFEISGTANVAGCPRPCLLAYHATKGSTHLFGDVAEETDIDGLMAWAGQSVDGDLPFMAHAPATVIAMETPRVPLA